MQQEVFDRSVSIQYLPFPEEGDKDKPLEAGKFLMPTFKRLFELACVEAGRHPDGRTRYRYITGLESENFSTPEEKEEIEKVKAELEEHFGKGSLDAHNEGFWRGRSLSIEKKTTFLNMNKPDDKLTYYSIMGGGYQEIAPSYELAMGASIPKRWFMVNANDFAELDTEFDRKINKAIAALEKLEESKTFDDMMLVHKVLISSDRGVTKKSPKALLYKDLSDFIHGKIVRTNKKMTAKQFLDTVEMLGTDKKKLYITAYVKEANYFNFLTLTEDNQLKNLQTGTKYGSTIEKAVAFLANPSNQTELDNLKERVTEKWKQ